jgi:predicted transcriptional regulator
VRCLCSNPGLSRADLAPAVELTKSTISLLVRELIAEGQLKSLSVPLSRGGASHNNPCKFCP